jgi:hypothetical protein
MYLWWITIVIINLYSVWDINSSTKKPIYSYDDPKKSSLTCLSISSYSPVFIACSSMDSNIIFMDINEKKYS